MTEPLDPRLIVDALVALANRYPGQPVALVDDGQDVKVGILDLYEPDDDDWFFRPVPLAVLPEKVGAALD